MLRYGNPGNGGGKGQPPSELRARLRGSFADRQHIAEEIADGVPTVRTRIVLRDLLPHVTCPNCGDHLEPRDKASVEIEVTTSASNKDRLGALELLAKYGLGQLREVSTENVRERLKETLEVIRRFCPDDLAANLINALRPVWTEK